MGNKVLSFGEVLWDAFGDGKKAGGAPMNVARHLVQQGMDVSFASSVGMDSSGDALIAFLKTNGLYSDLIQQDVDRQIEDAGEEIELDGQIGRAHV